MCCEHCGALLGWTPHFDCVCVCVCWHDVLVVREHVKDRCGEIELERDDRGQSRKQADYMRGTLRVRRDVCVCVCVLMCLFVCV